MKDTTDHIASMDTPSKIKRDADTYTMRLYDFIPVNPQLIEHVRRLDGFNVRLLIFVCNLSLKIRCSVVKCYTFKNFWMLNDVK